ncbi:MAG: NAD(P)/FAD-dependent oxidoreductase [bacterium]
MKNNFDLVIVGAGPAGSAAAFTAAESGISVLLLEEHAEIGMPLACAEGLSRSTIEEYLDIHPDWIAQRLSGSIVRDPQGAEFTINYPHVGWVLDRKKFDPGLANIAEQKGAVLKKKAKAIGIQGREIIVQERTNTKKYTFRYLIGADGVASKVGTWMGIDTRLGLREIEVCAEYRLSNLAIESQYAYLIFGSRYAPGGYAWIFPKSGNSANVGLGLSPLKTREKPKSILDRWIKDEFPEAKIEERIFGGVPAKLLKRFSGENFCLVGDAARFTDPLSGAGIANGVKSGIIAGRNAVRTIRGNKSHLESEMEANIINEIRWHHRVRNVYLKLTDNDYEIIFAVARKIFAGKQINDINTHQLVKQILLASPHLLKLGFRLLF